MKSSNLKKLLTLSAPYKKQLICALIALFVTAFVIIAFGELAKNYIDTPKSSYPLIFLVMVAALALAGYFRSLLINSICQKISRDLRQKIYQNLIAISPQFYQKISIGDVIARSSGDIDKVFEILSGNFAFFLRNLLLFVASIIFLVITSPKLSIISFIAIFLAILPIFLFAKKLKSLSKKTQQSDAKITANLEESILAIKEIQSYNAQNTMLEKFCQEGTRSLSLKLQKTQLKSFLVALTIFFAFLAIALILAIGIKEVSSGQISSGKLSSFTFYAVISAISSVGLGQIFSQLQTLNSALERIFFLVEAKSPILEKSTAINDFHPEKIEISFKNIDFSQQSQKILDNFSAKINHGEKIAIIGASGAGKSTIFNLLLRFYDVDNGQIQLNDIDIRDLSLANLRANFSYVLQDSVMFSATIYENISYDGKIPRAKINEIAGNNPAFSFIHSNLDNFIGEKGSKLSGGQKQRIAILRALLSDAKILLFDEATSAIDPDNEESILRLINEIAGDKTIIFISHKAIPLIKFDQVIEL